MHSGTNASILERKLNGRGHYPHFVAGQQIQASQAASEREIKVSLNNVIQDIQLSPQISMVTNVPACTVSLAHQAVTQKKQKRKISTGSTGSDSRSFPDYSWSSFIWFTSLTDKQCLWKSTGIGFSCSFSWKCGSIRESAWKRSTASTLRRICIFTLALLRQCLFTMATPWKPSRTEQTPTQATALWRGTFLSTTHSAFDI